MLPSLRFIALAAFALLTALLPLLAAPSLWLVPSLLWLALLSGAAAETVELLRLRPVLELSLPSSVGVGSELCVRVRLKTRSSADLPIRVRVELDAPNAFGNESAARLRQGQLELTIAIAVTRRGIAKICALWLRCRGSLGLMESVRRVVPNAEDVPIVPNVALVRDFVLSHLGATSFEGSHIARLGLDQGEVDSLASYEPGMDLRFIDWKASARHQALRARRFRPEQNQRLIFSIDTGRLMADELSGLQRVDHAVHAALLVAFAALRAGDLVGLHAYSNQPECWVTPGRGTRHLALLRQACTELSPRNDETNHFLGLRDLFTRLQRRSLVVIFSEFEDTTTAELMLDNLSEMVRRHVIVYVALDEPTVESAIAAEPKNAMQLARTVVAATLRRDRQNVLTRLRRAGVHVVSGAPGPATLGLLQRYLELKRRGVMG